MKLDLFDYELPEKSIAQYPSAERGASRLLVMHRDGGVTEDRSFSDLPEYIREGDLLVFNDSKVVKARLIGEKRGTGARIELFLLSGAALTGQGAKANGSLACECLAKPARRLKAGDEVIFGKNLSASVKARMEDGSVLVEFRFDGAFLDKLEELGHVPLPPYIKRPDEKCDEDRYQTVYAAAPGSAAAPTAGLHFTEELMERLEEKGAMAAFVTLHVGLGTFRPVKEENIEDHAMHEEPYYISSKAAAMINSAKAEGRRIICVGTTSVRTVESAAHCEEGDFCVSEGPGSTDIFIYPGSRKFVMTDGLVTNFHLPGSTLLMLVSAFYEREKILEVYRAAVEKGYRFFSYGDAMLIL